MILLHDYTAFINAQVPKNENESKVIAQLKMMLASAIPFRISPLALGAATAFLYKPAALEASRPYLFMPAPVTWLEWGDSGRRVGWLFIGREGGIHAGAAMNILRAPNILPLQIGCDFDLRDTSRPVVKLLPGGEMPAINVLNLYRPSNDPAVGFAEGFGDLESRQIMALLALINTPRIAALRPGADLSKLNKARISRGKVPLATWRDVHINLDQEFSRKKTGNRGVGIMPLHFVRAFMRVRLGKVELVRPHHRGNSQYGVVSKRYHVVRAEDNGSPEDKAD